MHYRSLCMVMLLTAAPSVTAEISTASGIEQQSYHQMYRRSQDQAHQLADCLAYVQDTFDLSQNTICEVDTAIATLEWFAATEGSGHSDLVKIIAENQFRAQQLNDIISHKDISLTSRAFAPSHLDDDASRSTLEDAQMATQDLINHALDRLHNTDWNRMLRDAQQFCSDWHLDTAGLFAAGATGAGLAYYYLAPDIQLSDIAYTDVLHQIGRYAAGTAAVMTYWTRHRTPDEIENYSLKPLKPVLNTYKQALHAVGFPGNMSKRPVMHGDPTTLPDAETYRKEGKAKGYRVPEERIPEDVVDFKLWNINILDRALLVLGWNCVMGEQLTSKNDGHDNDIQRVATLLTPVVALLPDLQ